VARAFFERRKPKRDATNSGFFIVARSLDVRSPCWCGRPSDSGGRHVKGEHVKDAANAAFQGAEKRYAAARGDPDETPPTHTPALRWHMKDGHVNDAAQGAVEDVPQDVTQDLGSRARAARALLARPPPPPPCLCADRAEMGAQLGSSVAFGSGCGQALPGVPRKAPLCLLTTAKTARQAQSLINTTQAVICHRPSVVKNTQAIAAAACHRPSVSGDTLQADGMRLPDSC